MPAIEELFDTAVSWRDWRALSDDALLSLDLTASEPEELPGVIQEVRKGNMPTPEPDYNMKGRDELVRCAFCRKPNHFIGVVAKYDDGARILVGRICAEKHLGATFQNKLKDFDAALARQRLVSRQKAVAGYCADLCEELDFLLRHPAVVTFSSLRKRMRDLLGPLWADLSRVADRDGTLTLERSVPDYAAIQTASGSPGFLLGKQRRQFLKRQLETKSMPTKTITENLGVIDGASFFSRGVSVDTKLQEQLRELRSITATLCSKSVHNRDITIAFTKLSDVKAAIATELQRLYDLKLAFSDANLARIAAWLNERAKDRANQGLEGGAARTFYAKQSIFGEHGWYRRSMSLPAAYHPPSPVILEILTAALAENGT